ncbi:MAG TPA: hypothetical protein VJN02_12985 [Gammaproteobacteria bacterium]|nr:hypothetical protein [Gammaproteobacteria bacterium]
MLTLDEEQTLEEIQLLFTAIKKYDDKIKYRKINLLKKTLSDIIINIKDIYENDDIEIYSLL